MRSIVSVIFPLFWASGTLAQTFPPRDPAPLYVASSIVNAANPGAEGLAPNTLATVYGQFLSHTTRSVTAEDMVGGFLPTTLRGTGVRVVVDGLTASVLFISPTQVNFLVPATLLPGSSHLQISLDSRYGPSVRVGIAAASPALFQMDPEFVVATRADGTLLTNEKTGAPGETIILYGTGLGSTAPRAISGQLVGSAAVLAHLPDFRVDLNGSPLPASHILYAGLAPGFAGLYQVNLRLPAVFAGNPVIRVGFNDVMSPDALRLHAQ